MYKQKSSYSRSSSTRSHKRPSITFQTLLKRRNDTIPEKQLYEAPLNPSNSRSLTKSIVEPQQHSSPVRKQIDIRQYVKQMGSKKVEAQFNINDRRHTQVEDDTRSQKSSRSIYSNHSAIVQFKPVQVKAPKTIEELENKIESLIKQSMFVLRKQRSNIGLNKWSQIRKSSSLDEDFNQIQTYFTELKLQIENAEHSTQKITDLNKKIQLLQKMMANENVQSELLKHQYFSWKNQRTNTTSFSNKKLLKDVSKFNKDLKSINSRNQNQPKSKQSIIKLNSTNQVFFKKPGKQYYLGVKPKKNSYSLNRQPMERSSYSTQFLNYGSVPTYNHKVDSVPQFGGSLAVKASTYQQQYKQKLAMSKNLSMKQLDCYQDKFKNPNISFMSHCKKNSAQSAIKKSQRASQKENSCWLTKKDGPTLINCMSSSTTADFYRSESNKNYIWHNTIDVDSLRSKDDILKSQIKDKKLVRMKDAFKALAMRR